MKTLVTRSAHRRSPATNPTPDTAHTTAAAPGGQPRGIQATGVSA